MDARTGKRRAVAILLLTIALVLAAILVAERFHLRLDLTSDGSYTLSKVSRELHKEIPERIRITYYLSPALADRDPGPRAVEDFLRELEAASRGKIAVELVDPSAGRTAAAVEGLGIQPRRMQVIEKNEQRVALVFSGIAVQYLDRTQVLPFVLGVDTLEYDLVKAVRAALGNRKPVAAVVVGDEDKSLDGDYKTLGQVFAANGWELREVKRGEAVPPEAGALLVLGNSAIEDYDAYRIDAYLASGGRAFFAVKGVDIEARRSLSALPLKNEALLEALESYGVKVERQLVLDRSNLTVPFQEASPFGGAAIRYVRYPHWVSTRPEFRDRKNPLTARLAGLDLYWPSPLTLQSRSGVEEGALVKSTPRAWLQTKRFAVGPQEEGLYTAEMDSTTGQYALVAYASGVLPPAYAGKAAPKREGAEALPPIPDRPKPSRIVVVGSADFANDLMTMTNSTFNAAFIADAVEWLSSGDELVSIRSRGARDARLSKVDDPRTKAILIVLAYAINIVLVPGGVIAFGLLRAAKRRRLARGDSAPPAAGADAVATGPAIEAGPDASSPRDSGEGRKP